MKPVKLFEQFLNEAHTVNQWGIESHHIGKLQDGKFDKFTDGTGSPFSFKSRPSTVSDTDKKLIEKYVDANHIVLEFFPAEDPNNNTMYDAVEKGAIKVMADLIKKEYGLKLVKTLKGKRHCSDDGQLCSVSHYLVFAK